MPQQIEVPGLGLVEFPDGMSDADMAAAIRRNLAQQPAPSPAHPADDVGVGEAMLIGAGREADRLIKGAQQLWYGATGNQPKLDALKAEQQGNDAAYAELQRRRPVATTVGSALPMLAVPMSGAATGAGMVGRAALAGGGIEGMKYGTAGERAGRAAAGAVGGAAGAGLGLAATRLLKPAGVGATTVSDDALAAAQRVGFKVTPGQATQNPAMMNFENYLARSPGSAGKMLRINDANQKALNRAAAQSMGEKSDDLSEGVFAAAKDRIGAEFSRLQSQTAPQLGDDFVNALAVIEGNNASKGSFAHPGVRRLVDKALDLASQGNVTGRAYKEIHTELSNKASKAFKGGDATLGQAFKTVRDQLDEAARASLPESERKSWDVARKQWGSFKTLTKSSVAEGGNVSAARAASALRADPRFRTGGLSGELADIARIGETFKSVPNPNSSNLAQQMIYGNPITGLPMLAVNDLMARSYLSAPMQRYMTRGLLDVGPQGQGALTALGAAGGDAALQRWLGGQ